MSRCRHRFASLHLPVKVPASSPVPQRLQLHCRLTTIIKQKASQTAVSTVATTCRLLTGIIFALTVSESRTIHTPLGWQKSMASQAVQTRRDLIHTKVNELLVVVSSLNTNPPDLSFSLRCIFYPCQRHCRPWDLRWISQKKR